MSASVLVSYFEHEGVGDLFLPSIEILPGRHTVCIRKVDRDFRVKSLFVSNLFLGAIKIIAVQHKRGDSPWCDKMGTVTPRDTELLFPMSFAVKRGDYLSLKAENFSERKIVYAPLIIGTEI